MSGTGSGATANDLLAQAVGRLSAADVPDAAGDARKLLAAAMGVSAAKLTSNGAGAIPDAAAQRFHSMVTRRAAREPMSHILGTRAFWKHEFLVTGNVLDPRPETETLVEAALALPFRRILDLGTGSGCLLISLLADRSAADGLGVDLSPEALKVAAVNAERIGVADRAEFSVSDWFNEVEGQFDLIVANPPYVDAKTYETLDPEVRFWEPRMALTPGGDGLDAYRIIARTASAFLTQCGHCLVEIGQGQANAVTELFKNAGFEQIAAIRDIDGRERVISCQRG